MTLATFRIIRTYTPGVFTAAMVALSMTCIYQGAVVVAAAIKIGAGQ